MCVLIPCPGPLSVLAANSSQQHPSLENLLSRWKPPCWRLYVSLLSAPSRTPSQNSVQPASQGYTSLPLSQSWMATGVPALEFSMASGRRQTPAETASSLNYFPCLVLVSHCFLNKTHAPEFLTHTPEMQTLWLGKPTQHKGEAAVICGNITLCRHSEDHGGHFSQKNILSGFPHSLLIVVQFGGGGCCPTHRISAFGLIGSLLFL